MNTRDLIEQKCVACEGGVIPFDADEAKILLIQVPGWEIGNDNKSISRKYIMKNFKEILAFVNRVGEVAESEGHHPDIHITDYKNLEIDLSTHAIGGLSNNDFILAAKINEL
jgi:4a-hydroxytetrahydrobiopterin dehydratase